MTPKTDVDNIQASHAQVSKSVPASWTKSNLQMNWTTEARRTYELSYSTARIG
jgi:hypothetical protein